jgi:hypothetical protein
MQADLDDEDGTALFVRATDIGFAGAVLRQEALLIPRELLGQPNAVTLADDVFLETPLVAPVNGRHKHGHGLFDVPLPSAEKAKHQHVRVIGEHEAP